MTPFPVLVSIPNSFVSLFIFYILSYLLSKTMGCFSGCLMSSASDQKLFCGVCSAFKCSFDEFVGEKVASPPYSSAILALFPYHFLYEDQLQISKESLLVFTVNNMENGTFSYKFPQILSLISTRCMIILGVASFNLNIRVLTATFEQACQSQSCKCLAENGHCKRTPEMYTQQQNFQSAAENKKSNSFS